jgi:hypothetical protein
VLDLAGDVDAPALLRRRLIAQALERNPDLHLVAILREPALGLVDVVGAQVGQFAPYDRVVEAVAGGGAGLHQCPVRLDAEGVHREDRRLAAVVEGAEQDLDVIVGADPVAIRERGVHAAVGLVGPDPEMDGGGRVPDQDLGRIGRGHAVHRRELGEAGEHRGVAPGILGEPSVHLDLGLESRRPGVQVPRPAVIDVRGIDQGRQGERQVAQHRGS